MTRQETLAYLQQNPDVSVLIIGGGINGVGTFRDLALQGVDVLLVEKSDFCSGASAASSHMVHGGLRYLENGEFRLVREALTERNRLLQNAPHYVKPLPTTIPIFNWFSGLLNAPLKFLNLRDKPSARGAIVIKLGLTMYDVFTMGQQTLPRHRIFSKRESLLRRPDLNPNIIATATYYDAWMPYPERITLELVLDAEASSPNAHALNYVRAIHAGKDSVELRDELTGETFSVRPKVVINAAGPWIDFVNDSMGRGSRFIGGTKGSHILVDHPRLHEATQGHEMFFENADGRITLFFPLEDRVLIGTTDIPIDNPEDARCTDDEIDYMLNLVRVVFPEIQVDRSHIVFHFSGVRPLPASDAATPGQISRDHSIRKIEAGARGDFPILSLVGGKWTTFRAFSEQVTDEVLKRLGMSRVVSTKDLPIGGGKGYPRHNRQSWISEQQIKTGLDRDRLETLLSRYGTRALDVIEFAQRGKDEPLTHVPDYTTREIAFIAQHERVERLDDLLLRRSLLAMLGKVDLEGIKEIAGIVAKTLSWKAKQRDEEIDRTVKILKEQHGMNL
ncbi:MAG: FAD-dependent oxidoreductase [Phototrophicales bacterium]|nr:MAG: FAD-dependent oxidoreductase [Phototrophicales bacterium]RMG77105.1 MAG: glycerol-3-phosphate dehydrogenase/oxidase [Chloroflexota bacterium]